MANVFEFHFNPLSRGMAPSGNIFDSFCFLPQTFFEKKQGNLYIIAEIRDADNQSKIVLEQLAEIIKKHFYQKPIFFSHDTFQLGLNQANEFLSNWKCNLHLAAVAIGPKANIKVSKTGDIKIILLRNKEAFDIGSNFARQPLSGKIFPDVIEGSLQKGDRFLMTTREVFKSFQTEKIIEDLCVCQNPKLVKQIFKSKKKIVREFSGACLLAFVKKHPIIAFLSRF